MAHQNIVCTQPISSVINKYLTQGWHSLVNEVFHQPHRVAKEKTLTASVDEELLVMLASLRRYITLTLLKCCMKPGVKYFDFGSSNIASDYDLTIVGEYAPDVIMCAIDRFLQHNEATLSHAFDTNFYAGNLYTCSPFFMSPTHLKNVDLHIMNMHQMTKLSL